MSLTTKEILTAIEAQKAKISSLSEEFYKKDLAMKSYETKLLQKLVINRFL